MSRALVAHVTDLLAPLGPVRARAMFGGFGLYLDGPMFGLIAWDTLYFKADAVNRPDYEAAGCEAFKPGLAALPYWRVPAEVLEDQDLLCAWARKAHEAALRAPPGKRRKK